MAKSLRRLLFLFFIFILVLGCITGCSKIFNRFQEESNEESQNDKKSPPKILSSMEEETDKIIEQIQQVKDQRADMERQKESEEKQGAEKEEQQTKDQNQEEKGKQGEEESGGEGSDKEKQNQEEQKSSNEQQDQGEKQDQQQKKEDQQPPKVDWVSIEKTIENLHKNWNNYEVQAQKDGASQNLLESYELQLDTLTNWAMSHNENETLKAANELSQYYAKFFNLYKHQAPPDIKDIRYNVRQIIIQATEDNWSEIDDRLQNISESWEIAKSRMEKPDKELNQKIEAAIEDFSRVTHQQNYILVKLKGDILLKNLQEIK